MVHLIQERESSHAEHLYGAATSFVLLILPYLILRTFLERRYLSVKNVTVNNNA